MTKAELAQIAEILAKFIDKPKAARKAPKLKSKIVGYKPKLTPAVVTEKVNCKAIFEATVVRGFLAKGYTNIALRSDGTNGILTYKRWLAAGRKVRKGEKSVNGMFHYAQTDKFEMPVEVAANNGVIVQKIPMGVRSLPVHTPKEYAETEYHSYV